MKKVKPIVKLWSSLTDQQKDDIRCDIMQEGGASFSSMYKYMRGDRTPKKLMKEFIVKSLEIRAGIQITTEELWPSK